MTNEVTITDTERRKVTIDIQTEYADKRFNAVCVSRWYKHSHNDDEYVALSLGLDELKNICKEVFKKQSKGGNHMNTFGVKYTIAVYALRIATGVFIMLVVT